MGGRFAQCLSPREAHTGQVLRVSPVPRAGFLLPAELTAKRSPAFISQMGCSDKVLAAVYANPELLEMEQEHKRLAPTAVWKDAGRKGPGRLQGSIPETLLKIDSFRRQLLVLGDSCLLKPTQGNDTESLSPSSSLSNVSTRGIKVCPFLRNSSCSAQQEKQDASSDSGNKKGKEDTLTKPTCPKQQEEPPDLVNCPPNKPTPASYPKSSLITARTFVQPGPSANKPGNHHPSSHGLSHSLGC